MNHYRKAAIGYGVLFILELFAVLWMESGITISSEALALEAGHLEMLKYFTVDSNIFMGIIAGVLSVFHLQAARGKRTELPKACYYWNLAATVGVALTMIVTVFFLSPTFGEKWMGLFKNSNFFLHLINPILAVVLFIMHGGERLKCFPTTLVGLIPMAVYAVFYCLNALASAVDGVVPKSADWYGFLITGNKNGVPLVIVVMCAATWLISFGLWALQQRNAKRI